MERHCRVVNLGRTGHGDEGVSDDAGGKGRGSCGAQDGVPVGDFVAQDGGGGFGGVEGAFQSGYTAVGASGARGPADTGGGGGLVGAQRREVPAGGVAGNEAGA